MADRDSKAQHFSTVIEPNFNGGLIHNDWIKATMFIKLSRAQRNAIPALSRSLGGDHTTLCFVRGEGIYELINNPAGDSTTDADWELMPTASAGGSIIPIGNWDVSNTAPELTDAGAANLNGQFYYATGAPNEVNVTYPDLFLGQTTQLINEDWIMSAGTHWMRVRNTTTWETLNKPQSIIDYENGIVIAHTHEVADVNNLQSILNSKWDDSNLADMVLDFINVPDAGIPNVAFLRKHFYDKENTYNRAEVNALLSSLSLGDPVFDGNRLIRKIPVVGDNTNTSALGETIDEMFYGFIKPVETLQPLAVAEVGSSATPQLIGSVDPKDAEVISGNVEVKDESDNVAASIVASIPPAITNFNQAATSKVIVAGINQSYKVEYTYKEITGGPDVDVVGDTMGLKGIYPFLSGMAATGLTGGGIYSALTKLVADQGTHALSFTGTNQRAWIAYPEGYGDLLSVTDDAGNELIGSLFPVSPVILSVQSVGLTINWQVNYKVYESQYDLTTNQQGYVVRFNTEADSPNLNLDEIAEGIVNKHFTQASKDKLDAITTPGADIGDMKKSEFAPLIGLTAQQSGVVDKAMELIVTGYNTTGAPIPAGNYIKIVGIDAPNFRVVIENADSGSSDEVDGFANETIADGDQGVIVIAGYNPHIDTTGRTIGDPVYLDGNGGVQFTETVSGSLTEVGKVLLVGNLGLIQSLEYNDLLNASHQEDWRANTVYKKHILITRTDDTGDRVIIRSLSNHNSGATYNPANYEIIGGDMQKSIYDPDEDGIVEHAYNQSTTFKNNTGVTIPKGRLVYISAFNSIDGTAEIALADKDTSTLANAITDEEILDGEVGRAIISGTVIGINVPVVPLLSPLYLDTLGTFTSVKPVSGAVQLVGRVIYGNAVGVAYFTLGDTVDKTMDDWVTGRPYIINESAVATVQTSGDLPTDIPVIIRCKIAHTSNVLLSDFDAGYWELVSGDMTSWVYDPDQKKLNIYDMDSMDDGSTKVAMTTAERTKLANVEDPTYKGIYTDPTALNTAYPTPTDGWSADVLSTSTKWVAGGGTWSDSLIAFGGDMQSSVYDPTNVAGDAFSMSNMMETTGEKIFTSAERTKLGEFLAAANYYNKTEVDNLLALKASITYVDNQDALRMLITTYDPAAKGADVYDMDNMDEGGATKKILTQAERDAIAANTGASHSHANKSVLDAITDEGSGEIISVAERAEIAANTAAQHTHSNKALLDTITDGGLGEALLADDGQYREAARAGIHDGTPIYKQDLFVLETGGLVYCDVELNGGGDLTVYFGSQSYILNCTTGAGVNGRARVQLTAGTTVSPQINNIYVYLNGGVATLAITTSLAAMPAEFAWIGIASVRTATNVAAEGAMSLQRFTDAVAHGGRGRISYMGERIRTFGSSWWEGVDQTVTLTTNAGALDDLQISVLAGLVYQLHRQSFPAQNSATDGIYITGVNGTGSISNYDFVTNLNQVLEYSNGSAVADGDHFNLVIWGAINKDTGSCKIFVNPSAAGYNDPADAYNDSNGLSNLSVPEEFRTVGFLIARVPLKYTSADNGTLEFINSATLPEWFDLRGVPTVPRDDSGVASSSYDLISDIQVVGTTNNPTRDDTAYAVLNEMTTDITPKSNTNAIKIKFNGSFDGINKEEAIDIAIFIDGVQETNTERGATVRDGRPQTISVEKKVYLSEALHTIDIRWKTAQDSDGAIAIDANRILTIEEWKQ